MSVPVPSRPVVGRSQGLVMSLGRETIRGYGQLTARWRPDPEFLVIGAKRGGSTSFFYDLLEHPQVCPLFPRPDHLPKATATKGIHYFDQNYFRGERWYRSHLPSAAARRRLAGRVGGPIVTGEASPYYLFHPAAPERAAANLPDVKILAVLRDPVQRAYSHWKERRRAGVEELDFADALAAEDDRVRGIDDEQLADPHFYSYAHENQTYARQGDYDLSVARWLAHFPRDRVLLVASEQYYASPQQTLDEAVGFLGLRPARIASGEVRNAAAGGELSGAVRDRLAARFAPHNEALQNLTGQEFPWH